MRFPKISQRGKVGSVIAGLSIVILIQAGLMWTMQAEAREPKAKAQTAEEPKEKTDQPAPGSSRAADPFDDLLSSPLMADPFFSGNGDPFEHMRQMRARMDRLFAHAMKNFDMPDEDFGIPTPRASVTGLRLQEKADRYLLRAELPGVADSDLKVDIKDGLLTIRGQRQLSTGTTDPDADATARSLRTERFEQSMSLPDDVDTAAVQVKFKDGVLQVVLPKTGSQSEEPEDEAYGHQK